MAAELRASAGLLECGAEAGRARTPGRGNQGHDVSHCGWRGLRSASRRAPFDEPPAVSERLLARSGHHARHDRSDLAILSEQFADLGAAGLAAGAGQAGLEPGRHAEAGAGPFQRGLRHLQSALRRADGVFRGHAGRVLPRAERLAGQGMARQGHAAARLDRDPDPERGKIRRRDRALRQGQALCAGADAGHGRHSARQARLLADLCRGRKARACRSASMPAAPITIRRPRSAGAPITSRIMSRRRRRSRPSSPA